MKFLCKNRDIDLFLFTRDRFDFNLSHEILNINFIENEIIISKSWNVENLWDVDFDNKKMNGSVSDQYLMYWPFPYKMI